MNNLHLWNNYQNACNEYLHAFCVKHDFDYEDAVSSWIKDIPGTITIVGDFYVSMETILTDINEDIPKNLFIQWYDYSLGDGCDMSYDTWLKINYKKIDREKEFEEMSKELECSKQELIEYLSTHEIH